MWRSDQAPSRRTQARLEDIQGPNKVEGLVKLLDRAATLRKPTQGYYRLRADCSERLGEKSGAVAPKKMAVDPRIPTIALDHFLRGEEFRMAATRGPAADSDPCKRSLNQDDLLRAIKEYQAALQMEPDHFWSHLQLGRCLLALGRRSEAVEALGACAALKPDSPWGYSARGIALALSDRFDEAHRDLDYAIDNHPEFWPARLNRGVTFWLQSEAQKAVEDFDAVLRAPTDQRLVVAAYYRGQVCLEQGKWQDALDDFDLVVRERPGFHHAYRSRAAAHFLLGNDDRGTDDLNTFLTLVSTGSFDSDTWQACLHRARFLRDFLFGKAPMTAERSRAIEQLTLAEFHAAAKQVDRPAEVLVDLGVFLESLGQVEAAIEAYDEGLKLKPQNAKLRNLRGWANLLARNDSDQALADFSETLKTAPENAEARTGIGFVHARLKAPDKAQKLAAESLLHGDGDYLVLHNVACIYLKLSQCVADREKEYQDLALVEFRRAVRLWRLGGSGQPNELEQIRREQLPPSLQRRKEFQQLFE